MPETKQPLKVFLCHASQDKPIVRELAQRLSAEGWIDPWLDKNKLLPGQDWRLEIEEAVEASDVVVICLSSNSANQEGFVQRELRYAREIALEKPDGIIFLIPLRLDNCEIPRALRFYQWVDYFGPEKETAYCNLLDSLNLRYVQRLRSRGKSKPEIMEGAEAEVERKAVQKPSSQRTRRDGMETAKAGRQERARKPKKKPFSKMDPAITAALIGTAGTILVAVITIFANRQPPAPVATPTATTTVTFTATVTNTPVPTDTVPPGAPTSTPAPATDTPTLTPTPIPPAALGKDWLAGCISTLWKAYPADVPVTERGDGCWKEPVHVFSAENGDLDFLADRRNGPVETYGLFAPLPERGTVTFQLRLRELSNVDLWMGVFAEGDVNSPGLLMVVPAGDVDKRVFVQKSAPGFKMISSTSMLKQGNGYSISFSFTNNSARGMINPNVFVTSPASIPSSQKWLFLGYRGLGGSYRVNGTFLGFELK